MFVWIIITIILLQSKLVDASGYSKLCPLDGSPIVQLEYDPNTKQFHAIDNSLDGDGQRLLREEAVQFGKHLSSHTFRGAKSYRLLETKTKYTGRQCPCDATGVTYCLVDSDISSSNADTCGVAQSSSFLFGVSNYPYNYSNLTSTDQYNATIECFDMASQTVFIRNAWPVIVLWYGALVIFFLATANGKYAQLCLVNTLCPCFRVNERYVDRALQREDEMRTRLRSLQAAAERADTIADGPGRFLRRSRGLRVRRNLVNDQDLTEAEQRDQAMRRWIEAAEAFGILNAREVSDFSHHQSMEYALRTKKFDAKRERERRKGKIEDTASKNTTPVKSQQISNDEERGEDNGPSTPDTPDTVATSGSDGSHFDFNESADVSVEETCPGSADEETDSVAQNDETPGELDEETFDCTICLSEVCDGEDVGVLSCHHLFHVDCLREWMLRRNACPLCQTEICAPRPVENDAARQNLSSESSEFSADQDVTEIHDLRNSRNGRPYLFTDSLPDLSLPEILQPVRRSMSGSNRPYLITASLPDPDVREPGIRRMSVTMSSPSRRESNRGQARRQQIEGSFSFTGW
jgi:hypothetical protein